MKKIILLAMIALISSSHVSAESTSVDLSHCSGEESLICAQKTYAKKILIHTGIIKRDFNVSEALLSKIDAKLEKFLDNAPKLQIIDKRVSREIEWLSDSQKDQRIKELLYYVSYKLQYHIAVIIAEKDVTAVIYTDDITEVMKMDKIDLYYYLQDADIATLESVTTSLYLELYGYEIPFSDYLELSSRLRDDERKTYQKHLSAIFETYFSDTSSFPTNDELYTESVLNLHKGGEYNIDPLAGYTINGCTFGYRYEVGEANGIKQSAYRISNCVEDSTRGNSEEIYEGLANSRVVEIGVLGENYSDPHYINQVEDLGEYVYPTSFDDISSEEKKEFYTLIIEAKYIELQNQ